MADKQSSDVVKVYWQPGCSSCLRTKEFLSKHGVPFLSVNVLADQEEFDQLLRLGVRRVPIVTRGDEWADGQVLRDVARVARIQWGEPEKLSPTVLVGRANAFMSAAQRFFRQIPEEQLDRQLPDRPRSYRQLMSHIFQIVAAFLDLVETGKRLENGAYDRKIPEHLGRKEDLLAYCSDVQERFNDWWRREGGRTDFSQRANVYYGEQSLHEYLERSAWHPGQHARQLQLIVEKLGLVPDGALGAADLEGLPMPSNVWDDKLKFA